MTSSGPLASAFPTTRLKHLVLFVLAMACSVQAQPADSVLAPVEVSAAPYVLEPARAPVSIAVRTRSDVERTSDPALTAEALGRGLPGVWISDRGNASTGERVLVRGLGWRAAFGVRGTHVVLDGVPLTLPDGQTPLNVIDPALVTRVEVVRGPASTFWGSGSAGVLALSTASSSPGVRVRAMGGAYGLAKGEASVRVIDPTGHLAVWGSALRQNGYRDHSASEIYRAGVSRTAAVGGGELGIVGLWAWMPRAEAPGGITEEAFREDPRQTRPIVIERDAHKRVRQSDLAVSYRRPLGAVRLRTTLSAGNRALQNPIVPRTIRLDRRTLGLRTVLEGGDALAWGVGAEAESQRDDRIEQGNFNSLFGPEVLTSQIETVRAGAAFGRLAARLSPAVTATAALRADALRYRADPGGDLASSRTITAASPSLGLSVLLPHATGATTLYANASGALDAPTTTELGNRTDGQAGFNPNLRPERTWGAEVGGRTVRQLGGGTVGIDGAAFVALARDLLLPFEVDEVTAYRNEGEARHAGVELALSAQDVELAAGRLDGALAVTLAQGTFLAGPEGSTTPEGNRVPGFPPRLMTWTATWTGLGLALGVDGESASGYAADSGGELRTEPYTVVHVRVAVPDLSLGALSLTPFVSLRNVGDAHYAGSVVVNPFGGRFVEPAAERHAIAGLAMTF